MEEFACLGILDPGGGKEKLLATIDKKELTPNKITVKIVDALFSLCCKKQDRQSGKAHFNTFLMKHLSALHNLVGKYIGGRTMPG